MPLRRRVWLVMLVCGLALAGGRAGRADDLPAVSREELIRKWDLNGDGTIDEGEAEVARARMRRQRAELQDKAGLDPLTGDPRSAADDQPRPLPPAGAPAADQPPAEPPRAKPRGADRRLPGTRPPDVAPALPATRSADPPQPTGSADAERPRGRDPRGGEAARRSSGGPPAPDGTAGSEAGGPGIVTGGARAGALSRPGYGARGPRPDLNAGRLPGGLPGRRPAPATGGLLPTLRPPPAAPAPRRTVDDFQVY